jgi:putative tryptophan/tyrosine transport system substrate-binding protein
MVFLLTWASSCQETDRWPKLREIPILGIAKIISHPALDAVEQGIKDEFAQEAYPVIFHECNAEGDLALAEQIAKDFAASNLDLVIGISTPIAQAVSRWVLNRPVLLSAITDPVRAQLTPTRRRNYKNFLILTDLTPVHKQLALLLAVKPSVRRLGMVYASNEANAQVLADITRQACSDFGLEFVALTVGASAEVKLAAQSIVNRVDAFYVSTDNTVIMALPALVEVANAARVPVISADPASGHMAPVLAALGFDYYQVGRITGRMAIEVLAGAPLAELGERYLIGADDITLLVNLDVAEFLGLEVPKQILATASTIIKDGKIQAPK